MIKNFFNPFKKKSPEYSEPLFHEDLIEYYSEEDDDSNTEMES